MTEDDFKEAVQIALPLILRFEGLRLRPYLCSAGVPTIGVGATYYPDGRRVRLTDPPITNAQAMVMLREMVEREYMPAVIHLCPGADTPHRLAALCSFAYNLGIGALKGSTLRKRVNAGDWAGASKEVQKWTRGGGRVLKGLVIRRATEAAMMQ
jgi:lysozyme